MSLFKVREWWSVKCGNGDEEFDQGCLAVANIDNDQQQREKIITGSLRGILRIYHPRARDFKIEDHLLELDLKKAILQVEAGRFSATGGLQLAVLHPRCLSVFSVQAGSSTAQGASYLQVTELYQHRLNHTAANMVQGSFGGISGADFICVQSYDGQLSFFEQESEAFSRYLPGFLVPGPLCYCQPTDSFITCNAAFELECYKYQVLAAATGEKATDAGVSGTSHRKQLQSDWRLILGEAAVAISIGRISECCSRDCQVDIVVLGEHTLFCVSESGEIRLQRRLDYHPAAVCPYPFQESPSGAFQENLLVSTHTSALLVYNRSKMVWAAKADSVAVAIRVAEFAGLPGLVVTLDDEGRLSVSYLGTDPPHNVIGVAEGKELDYEEMDMEHRQLLSQIRDTKKEDNVEPTEFITMKAQVSPSLSSGHTDLDDPTAIQSTLDKSVTAMVYICFMGAGTLENVHITIKPPCPIRVDEDSLVIPRLDGGEENTASVPIMFYASTEFIPAGCVATVTSSYTGPDENPHVVALDIRLPLTLFFQVVPPIKNAVYKLTLEANQPPPQLVNLFQEVVEECANANELMTRIQSGNVLTFQHFNGINVSIIVSRTGSRYRIQSDTFEAMWLLLDELLLRLKDYYQLMEQGSASDETFRISFQDPIPLQDFFGLIDNHFGVRVHLTELRKDLDKRANQFRSIQKRLLVRSKDRNPTPLTHLDMLLVETYHAMISLGDSVEVKEKQLKQVSVSLAAGVRLLLNLIRTQYDLDDPAFAVLTHALSPEIPEEIDVGWEEITAGGMTNLLKTTLAKNSKETTTQLQPLEMMQDTQKLKKHISIVLERISKGGSLRRQSSE
ncbi:hypothetical protein BSKO_10591 [Bryopsis sp. KO-2023]|nr:hypothetical protein BSKO_10591 [Bryopsis sp. KO-2023]